MEARKFKVFVVDDNPVYSSLIQQSIENSAEDCDVMIFQRSQDFFTAFDNGSKIQLAIIDDDLREADIDGLYILKDIIRRKSNVKVIALSGNESVERVLEYMHEGAWKYLTKTDNQWPQKIEHYVKEAIMDYKRSKLLDNMSYEQAIDLIMKKDELLSDFFNDFPELFAILDKDGRFTMANDTWYKRLNWGRDNLKQVTIYDLVCDVCLPTFMKCFTGDLSRFSCKMKTKNGGEVDVEWQVKHSNGNLFCVGRI